MLGEGIQKKSADLAKDVEEQTKKMQEAAAAKATEEEAPPEPTDEEVANIQVSRTRDHACHRSKTSRLSSVDDIAESTQSCR